MNIEELLPSKDVNGMDVIVTDEISTSDNEANFDTNKNIVINEYMEEDLPPSNDSSTKSACGKRKNESEHDHLKKRIKTEFINQNISDLVNEEIENDGFLSESVTQHINYLSDRSEYTEKDFSSSNANCEDPTDTFSNDDQPQTNTEFAEPNQNTVHFKSFYVLQDSLTPYSDATSSSHDPEKIRRPMNPFMVFSHYERKKILDHKPNLHNAQISKTLGKKWKLLSKEEKFSYKEEAEKLRQFHLIEYPNYRYQPRKKMEKETIPTFLNPATQSQTVITRSGPVSKNSYKISNWFGSNAWINSPMSNLCNGRTQSISSINPARLCLKVTIDNNFKETLKNPQQRESWTTSPMKSCTPQTYYSPAMYYASNLFSSSDTSSLSGIQTSSIHETRNPSSDRKTEANKSDIHTIIEEFMTDTSSSFFNPSTPSDSLYPTPPSTPLDFNELLLQDQQVDHQWYQQQQFYHDQQPQSSELLWQQQYQQENINQESIQNVNEELNNQSFTQNVNEEQNNQRFTQNVNEEQINQSFTQNVSEEHTNQNFTQNVKEKHINQKFAQNVNEEHHTSQNYTQNMNEDHTNQSFTKAVNEEHISQNFAQNVKVEYINRSFDQTLNEHTSENSTRNMNEEHASGNFINNLNYEHTSQNVTHILKEEHLNQIFTRNVKEEKSFIQNVKIEFDPNMANNIKLECD